MNKSKKCIKILIVDDDKVFRSVLSAMLSLNGFMAEEAGNGEEALKIVRSLKPDIIILDCIMPVMDGFETYGHLKNDPATKDIPVLFCSATNLEDAKNIGIKAEGYLEKPFTIIDFLKKINTILSNKN